MPKPNPLFSLLEQHNSALNEHLSDLVVVPKATKTHELTGTQYYFLPLRGSLPAAVAGYQWTEHHLSVFAPSKEGKDDYHYTLTGTHKQNKKIKSVKVHVYFNRVGTVIRASLELGGQQTPLDKEVLKAIRDVACEQGMRFLLRMQSFYKDTMHTLWQDFTKQEKTLSGNVKRLQAKITDANRAQVKASQQACAQTLYAMMAIGIDPSEYAKLIKCINSVVESVITLKPSALVVTSDTSVSLGNDEPESPVQSETPLVKHTTEMTRRRERVTEQLKALESIDDTAMQAADFDKLDALYRQAIELADDVDEILKLFAARDRNQQAKFNRLVNRVFANDCQVVQTYLANMELSLEQVAKLVTSAILSDSADMLQALHDKIQFNPEHLFILIKGRSGHSFTTPKLLALDKNKLHALTKLIALGAYATPVFMLRIVHSHEPMMLRTLCAEIPSAVAALYAECSLLEYQQQLEANDAIPLKQVPTEHHAQLSTRKRYNQQVTQALKRLPNELTKFQLNAFEYCIMSGYMPMALAVLEVAQYHPTLHSQKQVFNADIIIWLHVALARMEENNKAQGIQEVQNIDIAQNFRSFTKIRAEDLRKDPVVAEQMSVIQRVSSMHIPKPEDIPDILIILKHFYENFEVTDGARVMLWVCQQEFICLYFDAILNHTATDLLRKYAECVACFAQTRISEPRNSLLPEYLEADINLARVKPMLDQPQQWQAYVLNGILSSQIMPAEHELQTPSHSASVEAGPKASAGSTKQPQPPSDTLTSPVVRQRIMPVSTGMGTAHENAAKKDSRENTAASTPKLDTGITGTLAVMNLPRPNKWHGVMLVAFVFTAYVLFLRTSAGHAEEHSQSDVAESLAIPGLRL